MTATLFLASKVGLDVVLRTFITSGKCKAMFDNEVEPDKDKAFGAAFGIGSVDNFYKELNAWLLDPKAPTLVPTRAEIEKVMMTSTFPRPAVFPVKLLKATPRN